MSTAPRTSKSSTRKIDYPTSDGKPMAETELHGKVMMDLMQTLGRRYADDPMVYVWGDLMMFYEEGNRRKHLAPDVFVALGVRKLPIRDYYLIWEEGKAPDVVFEVTSKTTRLEDQTKKLGLYRDVLKVPEYFQFDPTEDYLDPALQGFRLVGGEYRPIEPLNNRLPSELLGLHLEQVGKELRLFDPASVQWLLTPDEEIRAAQARAATAQARVDAAQAQADAAQARADTAQARADTALARADSAEAENARLRLELEAFRRSKNGA